MLDGHGHRAAYREDARRRAPRFWKCTSWRRSASAGIVTRRVYAAAAARSAAAVPGADLDHEVPLHPDVIAVGGNDLVAVGRIVALLERLEATRVGS